jgi:hypothetical protein
MALPLLVLFVVFSATPPSAQSEALALAAWEDERGSSLAVQVGAARLTVVYSLVCFSVYGISVKHVWVAVP